MGRRGRGAACARALVPLGLALAFACGLEERADFLLGRPCTTAQDDCWPPARCLPHERADDGFRAFFCRTEESFDPAFPESLPLAYCDPERGLDCPGSVPCVLDRIRLDGGPRALVCRVEP